MSFAFDTEKRKIKVEMGQREPEWYKRSGNKTKGSCGERGLPLGGVENISWAFSSTSEQRRDTDTKIEMCPSPTSSDSAALSFSVWVSVGKSMLDLGGVCNCKCRNCGTHGKVVLGRVEHCCGIFQLNLWIEKTIWHSLWGSCSVWF